MALDSRLISTCRSRCPSAATYRLSGRRGGGSRWMPRDRPSGRMSSIASAITSCTGTASIDSESSPESLREMSSTSSRSCCSCCAALSIIDIHSRCSAVISLKLSNSPKPRIVLSGVRSSWFDPGQEMLVDGVVGAQRLAVSPQRIVGGLQLPRAADYLCLALLGAQLKLPVEQLLLGFLLLEPHVAGDVFLLVNDVGELTMVVEYRRVHPAAVADVGAAPGLSLSLGQPDFVLLHCHGVRFAVTAGPVQGGAEILGVC